MTIIRSASYTGPVALNYQNRIMTPLNTELQEFDKGSFIYDLYTTPGTLLDMFENVDDKLDAWELISSNVINQHAPIVEKRVKRKKLTPWMDSKIIECIRARDEFKKRAKTNIPARVLCTRGP